MTKDVLISISGLQMDVLEEEKEYEPIEVVAPANYFLKNGKHYIYSMKLQRVYRALQKIE